MSNSKVVPVEPTEEMEDAFWNTWNDCDQMHFGSSYKAMITAAPTPESTPVTDFNLYTSPPVEPNTLDATELRAGWVAEYIIQTHGEHFAALLVKALEERL